MGRRVQHRSTTPLAAAPGHPHDRLHRPPKAAPGSIDRSHDTHDRVRTDIVDKSGTVTLRVAGRLRHIGIGRPHAGTHVLLLVHDLDVRVVHAATGELLTELTINPSKDYQPQNPQNQTAEPPIEGSAVADVLRHHTGGGGGI